MAQDLACEERTVLGSRGSKTLRAEGKLPGVVYGEGKPAIHVAVDYRTFDKLLHSGERIVILKDGKGEQQTLIKDVQFDPFGDKVIHVDFHALKAGQKVTVKVEVVLVGTAKGHVDGGVISHSLRQLEVECLPTAIPDKISLNIEPLGIGDMIHVADVKFPEGVVPKDKPDIVIVACNEPRKMEEVKAVEDAAASQSQPEVIGAKKEDEPDDAPKKEGKK